MGLDDEGLNAAFALALPVTEEVERGPGITFVVRVIPLIDGTTVDGAVVLLRDVSELRSRDRLLLSKDATIREIHHRVKNNLQTISSLLRLQGRRLDSREAEIAVEDSVNRIQSIAVIHDILSREAGEDVPFIEILRSLIRTVEEGLLPRASELTFELRGDPGVLPATVATPLAIVLYELLQNVVEHGYQPDHRGGRVVIEVHNDGQTLKMRVADDGVGLPPGFEVETSTGLGLSIVRTLFDTELSGELSMGAPESGPGTVVDLEVPVHG